jgi:hypothetical protein
VILKKKTTDNCLILNAMRGTSGGVNQKDLGKSKKALYYT